MRSRIAPIAVFAATSWLVALPMRCAAQSAGTPAAPTTAAPRFRIELPENVLSGVPVKSVRISALRADGTTDVAFAGRPTISGLRFTIDGSDAELPPFERGELELRTNLGGRAAESTGTAASRAAGVTKVYVTASEIVVDPDGRERAVRSVSRIPRWLSLLPPLLAIGLAVWLRNVYLALLSAIATGSVTLARGDALGGLSRTVDAIVGELAMVKDGQADTSHIVMILFTFALGGMVNVMARSGGTAALVAKLARFTRTRESGQTTTWALGMVVFFDDYANTLLVGGTMRPVTDRLRISREKLAFLVDSTAAPVAGLAIVSTWVGYEIGLIADGFERLGLEWNGYSTFLATIPYRFYPILLLFFTLSIALTGRDFGAMLRAESRALSTGAVSATEPLSAIEPQLAPPPPRPLAINALLPIAALLIFMLVGLWRSGAAKLAAQGDGGAAVGLWQVFGEADSFRVLLLTSFAASFLTVALVAATRALTLNAACEAWIDGAKSMFPAVAILVLAWGVATVCDDEHLDTAGFLVEVAHGRLPAAWMPALMFVLAMAVSLATGSSFSTMGLLMPLAIAVTYSLLAERGEAVENHALLLGTIGAVLAGAIFGDHCSPISDTTVLSSAASQCDHLAHVVTQAPYAITVAVASLLCGYVPLAFGVSPWITLPAASVALFLIVRFHGRPPQDESANAAGSTTDVGR